MPKRLKAPSTLYVVFDPEADIHGFAGRDAAVSAVFISRADANAARQDSEIVLKYSFLEKEAYE